MLECQDDFDRVRAECCMVHPMRDRHMRFDQPCVVKAIDDFTQNKVSTVIYNLVSI
jgi:hypothetical protein